MQYLFIYYNNFYYQCFEYVNPTDGFQELSILKGDKDFVAPALKSKELEGSLKRFSLAMAE